MIPYQRIAYVALALWLSICGGYAQSLSLQEARRLAIKHNKGITIAQETTQKAEATRRAMKTNALPKLSLQGLAYYTTPSEAKELKLGDLSTSKLLEHSRLNALAQSNPQVAQLLQPLADALPKSIPLPSLPVKFSMSNSYYVALNIDQPIYMGGKISTANEMARIGVELSQLNAKKVSQELILKVDEAYALLQQAEALSLVAESYQKAIKEVARIVEQAIKAGMRTRQDRLRVEVEQAKAELQLQRAKDGLSLAQMNLNQIIGLPLSNKTTTLDDEREEMTIFEVPGEGVEQRPEYQMLQQQAALKRAEVKLVRSDFMPSLGLRASYSYMRGVHLNEQVLFNSHGPSLMLQLSVPIFRWGEGKHKLRAAQAEATMAQVQAEELAERMLLEQTQAQQKLRELEREETLMGSILSQTTEHLRITRERHKEGLETTANLLEAETLLHKAQSDLVVTKAKLRVQKSIIHKTFGSLTPNSNL